MSELKKMNLMNKELYKKEVLDNKNVIFEYVKILHEYLSHITKNININNMVHNNFIINRGYDLLKNIFLTLILYTNNLELSCFHLRKSYLYYTEFIGQIGEDSNSYLQLNSKDACLFVYKKTIYNINDDYKKIFKDTNEENTKMLNDKINFITKVEKYVVEKKVFTEKEILVEKIKDIRVSIIKIFNEIIKIEVDNIENIEIFLNFVMFSKFNIDKKISILHLFLKKINKEKIDKKKLITLSLYYENFADLSPLKFINKIYK
jgi:hypothetical protein